MKRYTAKELKELRYDQEDNQEFSVYFTEEFNRCLDQIQAFFKNQVNLQMKKNLEAFVQEQLKDERKVNQFFAK